MKKIVTYFFVGVMMVAFNSCERPAEIVNPTTTEEDMTEDEDEDSTEDGDDTTEDEEPSPIKGLWEYTVKGLQMTLDFGDKEVEYKCHTDLYDATATYKGTYTIEDNDITIEFTSLTSNTTHFQYLSPEEMPKEAELKDESTILYIDQIFTRK